MSLEISSIQPTAVPLFGDGVRLSARLPAAAPLPAVAPTQPEREREPEQELLAQALGDLADYVQKANAELNFRIDDDSGRVIVSLVDAADGAVLMQFPSDEALRIARLLLRAQPRLIDAEA